jgi:hypothetical protein
MGLLQSVSYRISVSTASILILVLPRQTLPWSAAVSVFGLVSFAHFRFVQVGVVHNERESKEHM